MFEFPQTSWETTFLNVVSNKYRSGRKYAGTKVKFILAVIYLQNIKVATTLGMI